MKLNTVSGFYSFRQDQHAGNQLINAVAASAMFCASIYAGVVTILLLHQPRYHRQDTAHAPRPSLPHFCGIDISTDGQTQREIENFGSIAGAIHIKPSGFPA